MNVWERVIQLTAECDCDVSTMASRDDFLAVTGALLAEIEARNPDIRNIATGALVIAYCLGKKDARWEIFRSAGEVQE